MGSVNPAARSGARALVLGGGYTGGRFAAALQARGVPVTVTHRQQPPPTAPPLPWLRFDPASGAVPAATALAGTTHLLVTIPPGHDGGDPVLASLARVLPALPLVWVGVLSTTGVYGDQGGAWVDETTPPRPLLERSRARLTAEEAWRRSGLPVQVFRLPAIYGPGRTPFESLRNGTARLIHKPGQVFSRVHVDDIVGGLLHCLALPEARRPDTVVVADTMPCPSSETLGYAAHLLGCRLPEVQAYAHIAEGMGAMARSFWSENRRASSRLLRETLGYRLRYPTYREGYRSCLEASSPSLRARNGSGSVRNGRFVS
ncbi:MAG: SDR family NAD(P)-dependent oxidoreductase [Synechococcaceae cyanobacterium]|nr:SDR family NAD(P)-dependent oxidoreductase [Synechococcaceae cyanobacterium]